MTKRKMTAEEFDEYFDNDGDIADLVDVESIRFPNRKNGDRRINISMPAWMVDEVDAVARHYGNTRQGMINVWVAERLKRERSDLAKLFEG